jgi:hypothetical protein
MRAVHLDFFLKVVKKNYQSVDVWIRRHEISKFPKTSNVFSNFLKTKKRA